MPGLRLVGNSLPLLASHTSPEYIKPPGPIVMVSSGEAYSREI